MASRHVVHESTRKAVLSAREKGESYGAMAERLGDVRYKPALSSIVRGADDVGKEMERRIRVAMGLDARPMKPSELKRRELSARLRAAGVTWMQAMEIALDVIESQGELK